MPPIANKQVGDVPVIIGGDTYVLRMGNNEWAILEAEWNVEGLSAVYKHSNLNNRNFHRMIHVAMSRHQPDITIERVRDLLDYKDENGDRPLADAMAEAVHWAAPKERPATEKTEPAAGTPPTPMPIPDPSPSVN